MDSGLRDHTADLEILNAIQARKRCCRVLLLRPADFRYFFQTPCFAGSCAPGSAATTLAAAAYVTITRGRLPCWEMQAGSLSTYFISLVYFHHHHIEPGGPALFVALLLAET
jgi:hypothetical protein